MNRMSENLFSDKKNVLVLTTSFPHSDEEYAGIAILELCRRLVGNFNLTVLAPHAAGQKKKEHVSGLEVRRFQYAWPSSWQRLSYGAGILTNLKHNFWLWFLLPGFLLFFFLKGLRLVKQKQIDIIHAHWLVPGGLLGVLLGKITNVPVVVTVHGSDLMILGRGFLKPFIKFILRNAAVVSVVNRLQAGILTDQFGVSRLKPRIISMGIDTKLFVPKSGRDAQQKQKKPLLLFVGLLNDNKGVKYLIKALPDILKIFPQTKLRLVGAGPLEERLKWSAERLGVQRSVEFMGGVPNLQMPRIYFESSVFVLPSFSEGLPGSILEAMACGCPVVASAVGGIPEVISHKKTGLLIKAGSSEDITQSVNLLLSDQRLAGEISENARKLVEEKFDWEVITKKFEKIYGEII